MDVKPYGALIGKVDAEVCSDCNETFFSEQNSIDVRISKRIAEFAGLRKGAEVRVYPEGRNRIIIEH